MPWCVLHCPLSAGVALNADRCQEAVGRRVLRCGTTTMRLELVHAGSGEIVVVHVSEGVVSGVGGQTHVEEHNETRRNDGSRRWACTSVATGARVAVWTGWGTPTPRSDSLVVSSRGFYTTVLHSEAALRVA